MNRGQRLLYRLGQAHGIMGYGGIPGADGPTALMQKYMPEHWPWSKGMRSKFAKTWAPRAAVTSAVMQWETIGGRQRLVDVAFQRGTGGSAWESTPKSRFSARHTHGFFVSPKDRMRRNAPLPYGQDYLDLELKR